MEIITPIVLFLKAKLPATIFSFIFGRAANSIIDKVQPTFHTHFAVILNKSIKEYEAKSSKKFRKKYKFYKDRIVDNEFKKIRPYFAPHKPDVETILRLSTQSSKVITPLREEVTMFLDILWKNISLDEDIKKLEVEAFEKQANYEALAEKAQDKTPMLEIFFTEDIQKCFNNINNFNLTTAIEDLNQIEGRIKEVSENSDKVKAELYYTKAVCYQALGKETDAWENFIAAYKNNNKELKYLQKACISYFYLKNEKYKDLKTEIYSKDEFNEAYWAVKVFENDNPIAFIENDVTKHVLKKNYFQRLIFNYYAFRKTHNITLIVDILVKHNNDYLNKRLPENLKHENLAYWIYILNITHSKAVQYLPHSRMQRNTDLDYLFNLSSLISNTVSDKSELGYAKSYKRISFIHHWLECEIYPQTDSLQKLKLFYKNYDPYYFDAIQMARVLLYNYEVEEALKTLESFSGKESLEILSYKAFFQMCLYNGDASYIIEYINKVEIINSLNLEPFVHSLIFLLKRNLFAIDDDFLDKYLIDSEDYKSLLQLTINSFDEKTTISISNINDTSKLLHLQNKELKHIIAKLYKENGFEKGNKLALVRNTRHQTKTSAVN